MKKIVFTEEFCGPENLFPFTLTRQVQDIRIGIYTIREKWEQQLELLSFDKQEGDYKDLERAIEIDASIGDDILYLIHGNILPTPGLVRQVKKLKPGEFISVPDRENIVYCISGKQVEHPHKIKVQKAVEIKEDLLEIKYPWDIFQLNSSALALDFAWVQKTAKKGRLSDTNKVINPKNIFIEKGAVVEHCLLNATDGPIHIGKNAVVMEGSCLRGPLSVGEGAVVKMGTRIYGATTIGPFCTVGGEIKNSVLFAFSNKAHDGYLGDSVIGAWCNIGAGTSNSNLKNNACEVMVYAPSGLKNAGIKCGVLMGDYTRTAINTSINTGTVIGVCCNVFGNGLTPRYIPSFSWGSEGINRYKIDKALQHIQAWKALKNHKLDETETFILKHIFDHY